MKKLLVFLFLIPFPLLAMAGEEQVVKAPKDTLGIAFQSSNLTESYLGVTFSPVEILSVQAMAGIGKFTEGPFLDRGLFGKATLRLFKKDNFCMTGHVLYGQWRYTDSSFTVGDQPFNVKFIQEEETLSGFRFGSGLDYSIPEYNSRAFLEMSISPLKLSEIEYNLPEEMINLGVIWYVF